MKMRPATVTIVGNDEALVARARSELSRSGCHVRANAGTSFEDVALVVRDWRDARHIEDPGVPVVTLDLALIGGQDLIDLIGRVLGVESAPSFAGYLALFMVIEGRIPIA